MHKNRWMETQLLTNHFFLNLALYAETLTLGVDRLSAPILSILPIIDIGHLQNRFADNFFFFIMQTSILFTGDIISW